MVEPKLLHPCNTGLGQTDTGGDEVGIKTDKSDIDPNTLGKLFFTKSASVPRFPKGEYRYENPDIARLMPRAKMYTLGNDFVPKTLGASGLNYHGKNPLLSLLVNQGLIKAKAYNNEDVDPRWNTLKKLLTDK